MFFHYFFLADTLFADIDGPDFSLCGEAHSSNSAGRLREWANQGGLKDGHASISKMECVSLCV